MFSFLKAMLLPKLQAAKDAILSGSGAAMNAAVASLFDAVGAADAAANLRTAAEGLTDGDKAKLAKAEMKLQAGLLNYLLGLEGEQIITVRATAPDGVPAELAACLDRCQPVVGAMHAAPTAIFTPEQRERFALFLGAILRGFFDGK